MANYFECYACHQVAPLLKEGEGKAQCPICGSTKGSLLSSEEFMAKKNAGVFYDLPGKKKKNGRYLVIS